MKVWLAAFISVFLVGGFIHLVTEFSKRIDDLEHRVEELESEREISL